MAKENTGSKGAIGAELIQKARKYETRFTLVSEKEIEVEVSSKNEGRTSRVNLSMLNAPPMSTRYKARLLNKEMFLTLSVVTICLVSSMISHNLEIPFLVGMFLFGAAIFLGISFYYFRKLQASSYNVRVYEDKLGRSTIVLDADKPSQKEVEEFCVKLNQAILSQTPNSIAFGDADSISARIARLNDLKNDGVLSDEEFESAKLRVLNTPKAEERKIGFQVGA